MGALAVMVPRDACPPLDAATVRALRGIGVTHVTMLADADEVTIVVEGWAFDPQRSTADAQAILAARSGGARVLHEIARTSLTAEPAAAIPDR